MRGCFSTSSPFFSIQRPFNFLPQSPAKGFLLYYNVNIISRLANVPEEDQNAMIIYIKAIANNNRMHRSMDMPSHKIYTSLGIVLVHALPDMLVKEHRILDILLLCTMLRGLDPAGPYFEGTDKIVRLDQTDGTFVDAIYSDGSPLITLGFGMMQPVGHVDYYPNGGNNQPGCDKDPITNFLVEGSLYEGGKQYIACSHLRSYIYFTESINSRCPFNGYRCKDFDSFQKGLCTDCSNNNCGQMGFHADLHKPRAGTVNAKYYLDKSANGPFCRYHYQIQVTIGSSTGFKQWRGKLYASKHGTTGDMPDTLLTSSSQYFTPGQSYTFLATAPHDVGDVNDVVVHWHHQPSLLKFSNGTLSEFVIQHY
ncbi:PNLIP [Mytilus coruscus]|uniref:PNLIP n=1 Tax=Mytilus coruscus TaxID=42192 RepID=A0A6J8A563_MYTCO|nr:PNLIP [Mytilus coruscus]